MSYSIKAGDTLSALASRFGTSVSALMKSNSQIQDKNLIFTGAKLTIPGASDGFDGPGGSGGPGGPGGAQRTAGAPDSSGGGTSGPGGSPFEIAQSHLGKNAGSLKYESGGVGAEMEDWVPNNVNCANFVSGCLAQAGQISDSQKSAGVMDLMGNLDGDSNFKRVSLSDAKPGDVVSMKTPGGQHVVMFAGMKDGVPQFIGSNNINSDGSQRISYTSMNYPIMAIHQYQG